MSISILILYLIYVIQTGGSVPKPIIMPTRYCIWVAVPSSNENKNRWIPEIEYLRGFAIICVLAAHTSMMYVNVPGANAVTIANSFILSFCAAAVPIFIFISGFALRHRYSEKFSALSFYKKRALVALPYLVFSAVYMLFAQVVYFSGGFSLDAGNIITTLLTAKPIDVYSHLWFFLMVVQFYLLYPLIDKAYSFFEKRNKLHILFVACLLIQTGWTAFYVSFPDLFPFRVFPEYILYFIFGMFAAKSTERLRELCKKAHVSVLLTVVLMLAVALSISLISDLKYNPFTSKTPQLYIYPIYIIEPFFCVAAILLLYKIALALEKKKGYTSSVIVSFGRLSFCIYLVHIIFWALLILLLGRMGIGFSDWYFYPIFFVMMTASSYAAAYVLGMLPRSDLMFGYKNKRKGA